MADEFVLVGEPLNRPIFEGSLQEFFFQRWKKLPKRKTLLVDSHTGESLNSEQLLSKSIQAAQNMKKHGLKLGDHVLFYGRTSINFILAEYGVLLQGAVFAPIDPLLKLVEVKHMMNVIQPRFIVCEGGNYPTAKSACEVLNYQIIFLISDSNVGEDFTVDFRTFLTDDIVNIDEFRPADTKDSANEVAIIASSSGTTGLPKGVTMTHRNLITQLMYWDEILHAGVRYLQSTQFFWVSAIIPSLITPVTGLSRVFIKQFDPQQMLYVMDKYKTEWLMLTPADLSTLLNYPHLREYDVSCMKHFIIGGTALLQFHVDLIDQKWPHHIDFMHAYGATELSGLITYDYKREKGLTVGRIAQAGKMKIVDPSTGKSLPSGQTGEVCFQTPCMTKGYINNEEATRECIDKQGWYHTGDVGYYDHDGYLYITGRNKEIFKYRAVHISPSEMESVILSLPGVKEVGVVGIPHPGDVNQPMAIVVKKEGFDITEEEIVRHVEEKMADTKRLKAGVRFVNEIPRTTTGKVKRTELQVIAEKLYRG